jgi:hypothetical protein
MGFARFLANQAVIRQAGFQRLMAAIAPNPG